MNLVCLNDLFRHMEWADAEVWRAVFARDEAINDQRLRDIFYHLHLVQHAHLQAWQGITMQTPFPTFDDTRAVWAWGRTCYHLIFDYLKQLSEGELEKSFQLPWTELVTKQLGQAPAAVTLGEMMMQAPLHSLYHRGQINMRLREVGGEPPAVDYIVWRWLGKPNAVWEQNHDGG